MSEHRGCLKRGCLGCLALLGVVLLIVVVMLILGIVTRGGDSRIESIDHKQVLPVVELPARELPRIPQGFEIDRAGRIELDLSFCEFEIVAGPPGSPLQVVGDYDAGRFDLEQSFTEMEDGSWVYEVSFDRKGIGFAIFNDDQLNRVTVTIPRQTPIELAGTVGIGESRIDLGGLWLLDLDLEFGVGEHRVYFSEPTLAPLARVRLDSSLGVLHVGNLGNASPRDVEITHTVGETSVDLNGEWLNDADIEIRCGIGVCRVDTPDDTGLKLLNVGVMIGESSDVPGREAEHGQPTLSLSVSASIGELRIR